MQMSCKPCDSLLAGDACVCAPAGFTKMSAGRLILQEAMANRDFKGSLAAVDAAEHIRGNLHV